MATALSGPFKSPRQKLKKNKTKLDEHMSVFISKTLVHFTLKKIKVGQNVSAVTTYFKYKIYVNTRIRENS